MLTGSIPNSKRVESQLKEIEDKAGRKKEEVRCCSLQCVKSLVHNGVSLRLSYCNNNSKLYKRPAPPNNQRLRCPIDYPDADITTR